MADEKRREPTTDSGGNRPGDDRPGDASAAWRGRPVAVWALLGLLAVLGVRAIAGGAALVLVPSGDVVGASTTALAASPFLDFRVPGLALLFGVGLPAALVAVGVYRRRRWAWYGSVAVALALATYVLVEGLVLGFGRRLQYPNLAQAAAMVLLAALPSVRRHLGREGDQRN